MDYTIFLHLICIKDIFMFQLYHTEHILHNENTVSYVLIQRFHFLCASYKDHLHLLQTVALKMQGVLKTAFFFRCHQS